jgi:signal transduction histidine kinase
MEQGELPIARAHVSPHNVVTDAVEAEQSLASAASIPIHAEVAPAIPDVSADRDRLLQIFENLVGNALKFTPAGGAIGVGAAARDHEVLFWVSDTGAGIDADDVPHLFDRFWQGRKGDRRGLGLGLVIVKGLVEAHGGRIWAESAKGRGTTFFFTIPTTGTDEGDVKFEHMTSG